MDGEGLKYDELRKARGWPTPINMRRVADALDSLTPARHGDVLRWFADLCDAALTEAAPPAEPGAAALPDEGLDAYMTKVVAAWREHWEGRDHRYGTDFAAFLGERLMTDYRLRDQKPYPFGRARLTEVTSHE